MTWRVVNADCVAAMADMEPDSIDAIVTDPPYGLEFMGKEWDRLAVIAEDPATVGGFQDGNGGNPYSRSRIRFAAGAQEWHHAWALEAFRVLKPGGHLLAFGGTRTYHRLACAVEDAGFEVRDCLAWLYGSGFPKSLDVSKAIDKAAGADREVERFATRNGNAERRGAGDQGATYGDGHGGFTTTSAPATPDAERWQGWGTALKPAFEPIVMARKPLSGTVAANVLEYGTGALNVDATRIEGAKASGSGQPPLQFHGDNHRPFHDTAEPRAFDTSTGRWPANVILDPEAAAMLDDQTGDRPSGGVRLFRRGVESGTSIGGHGTFSTAAPHESMSGYDDAGGASRFFYTAKTSRAERENGRAYATTDEGHSDFGGMGKPGAGFNEIVHGKAPARAHNNHPTVKPLELMRWLVRLVTPPGGTVLDPFLGSGTTVIAALREGFDAIGIERDSAYAEIARSRIQGDSPLFNVGTEVV